MKPKIESDISLSIAMDVHVVWQNGGQTKTTLDKIPRELR